MIQYSQMLAHRRGAEAQLLRDVNAADPIYDEIPIHLRSEVFDWIFKPIKNLQPTFVCECLQNNFSAHGQSAIFRLIESAHG